MLMCRSAECRLLPGRECCVLEQLWTLQCQYSYPNDSHMPTHREQPVAQRTSDTCLDKHRLCQARLRFQHHQNAPRLLQGPRDARINTVSEAWILITLPGRIIRAEHVQVMLDSLQVILDTGADLAMQDLCKAAELALRGLEGLLEEIDTLKSAAHPQLAALVTARTYR